MCSHKWKIQNISDGIFILSPGSSPGAGLWGNGGTQGVKHFFFQTWSCSISKRRGWQAEQIASNIFILGPNWRPWGEVKGQISLNFGYHVIFKDFYTKFCVCSHKWKIQNISNGIFFLSPGSSPGVGLWGNGGTQGVKHFFFKHGHVAYQIDGNDKQNKLQHFHSRVKLVTLWRGQKVKYHLISIRKSISKIFIPNFVCVLTNERYITYQTEFSFCPLGHAPGVGL